jgi:transposase-like protein
MSSESRKLVKATENIANELGIRFCTACNMTKSAYGGAVKPLTNGRTRWLCGVCASKRNPAGFKNK